MTDEEYIEAAREQYQRGGTIEIDEGAVVSRGSDPGAYVQAWVWVDDPEFGEESESGEEPGSLLDKLLDLRLPDSPRKG